MNFLKTGILLGAFTLAAHADQTKIPQIHGRTLVHQDTTLWGWNGIQIKGEFTGSKIGMKLLDLSYYNVWIDGQQISFLNPTTNTLKPYLVPDASGITWLHTSLDPYKTHRLELYKRSEGGVSRFMGLLLDDTAHWTELPTPSQKIEVFGDSQTAGYGIESPSRVCTNVEIKEYTNYAFTFPHLLEQKYPVEIHTQAMSGLGVVRNYGGSLANPPMTDMMKGTLPYGASEKWPLDSWKPQIVIIGLGSNDFSTPLNSDEKWSDIYSLMTAFKAKYHQMIDSLRRGYGGIPFILTYKGDVNPWRISMLEILQEERKSGYNNVHFLQFPPLALAACQWHSTPNDHQIMANSISRLIDSLDLFNANLDPYQGQALVPTITKTSLLNHTTEIQLPYSGQWGYTLWDAKGKVLTHDSFHGDHFTKPILNEVYWVQFHDPTTHQQSLPIQITMGHTL